MKKQGLDDALRSHHAHSTPPTKTPTTTTPHHCLIGHTAAMLEAINRHFDPVIFIGTLTGFIFGRMLANMIFARIRRARAGRRIPADGGEEGMYMPVEGGGTLVVFVGWWTE